MNFIRAFFSVGIFTIICRVTGYCRDLLMVNLLGANAATDALAIVFKLPALFRRLFAEGAFHVSFLPVFTESDKNKAFAGMVLTLLLGMVGLSIILVEINFEWLITTLFADLKKKPNTLSMVMQWGPITFPYIFFISIVSFLGSILNAYGRFSLLALSHAIGNIAVISYVFMGTHYSTNYGYLFSWGVLISGAIQLTYILIPYLWSGYGIHPRWPQWTPYVKKFIHNFIPGLLGVGVIQLNALVGLSLATGLPEGSVSFLNYADRLYQLPLSIIGISLSSILLPLLSEAVGKNDTSHANAVQHNALCFASVLGIPSCLFLVTMAFPVISTLFSHGKLFSFQLHTISHTLIAYSTGLPAYILIKILNTRFFAQGNTKVPLIASCFNVSLDIIIALSLLAPLKHVGIALAVSLSSWANVIFLLIMMKKQYNWTVSFVLMKFWIKSFVAGLFSALFWLACKVYLFDTSKTGFLKNALILGFSFIVGIILFLFAMNRMRAFSLKHLKKMMKRSGTKAKKNDKGD